MEREKEGLSQQDLHFAYNAMAKIRLAVLRTGANPYMLGSIMIIAGRHKAELDRIERTFEINPVKRRVSPIRTLLEQERANFAPKIWRGIQQTIDKAYPIEQRRVSLGRRS